MNAESQCASATDDRVAAGAASRRGRATLVGASAILMWSSLGLLGTASGAVPPFLLTALCFGLSGALTLAWVASRPGGLHRLRQPPGVILFGTLGLFGFHALYFTAIRHAPPVEANLINYAWPLLIVLLSALLPGERLRVHHVLGAVLGLAGVAAILTGGEGVVRGGGVAIGHAAAAAAALWWAGYSVLSRRLRAVPTDVVALYCVLTALLSLGAHLLFEPGVWPVGALQWGAVVLLGLFPVGLAFFAWDHGVKHGNIQVLGAAAYAAPMLSTLILVAAGYGAMTAAIAAACVAITLGALIASWDLLRARSSA